MERQRQQSPRYVRRLRLLRILRQERRSSLRVRIRRDEQTQSCGKATTRSGRKRGRTRRNHSSLGKKFDYDKVMAKKAARKSLTFAEKYALSDEIVKERYAILKDALTATPKGTPKIKSRISKQCDTYRREGDIVAKVTIIGTSLRINLPLDPEAPEFNDGRTPHTATGHKKVYEEVPFQFKVNSKLALKRALALIDHVK